MLNKAKIRCVCEGEYLIAENVALKNTGNKLAQAVLHVATEYDGVHRLMLAVSEWAKTIANEGGRGKMFHDN